MSLIVCATRGGEGSRMAQIRAIKLAQETKGELVFLYVVDTQAAEEHDDRLNPALEAEMSWVGRVLLGVAEDFAARYGWESRSELRTGRVRDEIEKYLREQDVHTLVLGAPWGTTTNVFGDDAIERFADEISRETEVKVEIARPEDEQ
jgi:nucleotide-binding universal stress UspA family protein